MEVLVQLVLLGVVLAQLELLLVFPVLMALLPVVLVSVQRTLTDLVQFEEVNRVLVMLVDLEELL